MKQCIMSENRFDFLRELVKNIPDITVSEENALECSSPGPSFDNNSSGSAPSSPGPPLPNSGSFSNGQPSMAGYSNYYPNGSEGHQPNSMGAMSYNDRNNFQLPRTTSTVIQHVGRPPKLARYESAPSGLSTTTNAPCTSGRNFQIEIAPNINTPTPTTSRYHQPTFKIDLTNANLSQNMQNTHISTPVNEAVPFNMNRGGGNLGPPFINFDFSNAYNNHTENCMIEQPAPPVIQTKNVVSSPVVKIDYSNFDFGTTPQPSYGNQPKAQPLPSPSTIKMSRCNTAAQSSSTTLSEFQTMQHKSLTQLPPPSLIHVDQTNFGKKPEFTSPNSNLMMMGGSSGAKSNNLDLDEDYDNI